jgi:transposase
VLSDKGYDSDGFRAAVAERGAEAVIPSSRSRSQAIPYDKHLYKECNLVERFLDSSPRLARSRGLFDDYGHLTFC